MRTLFLAIAVVFCISCDVGKSQDQPVTNNTATVVDTNLVACVMSIEQRHGLSYGPSPICFVSLVNNSPTNSIIINSGILGLRLSAENLFAIELVNTNGKSVEKTDYGRKFGQSLTQKQLNDWAIPIRVWGNYSKACFEVPPAVLQSSAEIGAFSIPKAFKITQAGEYTLHVRMRLIQNRFFDQGIIRTNIFGMLQFGRGRKTPTVFQSTWLPEVTAKVQIRLQDIPPESLLSNNQTNPTSK